MTNVSDPRLSLCENDRFQKRSYSACFQPENYLYKNLGNSVVLVLILVCHSRILSIECNLVFLLRTVHYTTGDGRALSTYICRVKSCVCVFQNIDPPPPFPPSECVLPPQQKRGVHTRRAVSGVGGHCFGRRMT